MSEKPELNKIQTKVIEMVSEGFSEEQIGKELDISTMTVKIVIDTVLKKLDCKHPAEVISKYKF
ncbi:MAG: LuxR C-terminal-related transcriptional regulator [Pseudomonadota bacterium]